MPVKKKRFVKGKWPKPPNKKAKIFNTPLGDVAGTLGRLPKTDLKLQTSSSSVYVGDLYEASPSPETHIRNALIALGIDVLSEGVRDTPKRFCDYLREYSRGYIDSSKMNRQYDLVEVLKNGFDYPTGVSGMVLQTKIPFRAICEHHLLPMFGYASIGYIPSRRVVGLSKMARLVEVAGLRRPAIQEVLTDEIADALVQGLDPKGVMVVITAEHTCMTCRGVAAFGVKTTTSSLRGVFRDVPQARQEFMSLMRE